MTRVWFKGLSWCPKYEQSRLIFHDEKDKVVLAFQVCPHHISLIADELERARNGCCYAQLILASLLSTLQHEVKSLVLEEVSGYVKARLELESHDAHPFSCPVDPVAAIVVFSTLSLPIYLNANSYAMTSETLEKARAEQTSILLPEPFSRFIQESEAFGRCDGHDEKSENP